MPDNRAWAYGSLCVQWDEVHEQTLTHTPTRTREPTHRTRTRTHTRAQVMRTGIADTPDRTLFSAGAVPVAQGAVQAGVVRANDNFAWRASSSR